MLIRLLLLFCSSGYLCAKNLPDVDCTVINLEYVSCSWEKTPNVTFSSWFHKKKSEECTHMLPGNNTHTVCKQPYEKFDRFETYHTLLRLDNETREQKHELKGKVKFNPPSNLTVKYGSDQNLWFYWNMTHRCEESEVRHRKNQMKWQYSNVFQAKHYSINLPSNTSKYELHVRSRLDSSCGGSDYWSEWSEPAVWGSNNSTESHHPDESMSVWTPVIYATGTLVLILLVVMLLHHERLRIILIPVVPKPSLVTHDIEEWFEFFKNQKEDFKANYSERACSVREYTYVSQSDSFDGSSLSVSTDQTNCSDSPTMDGQKDPAGHLSSSAFSSQEELPN